MKRAKNGAPGGFHFRLTAARRAARFYEPRLNNGQNRALLQTSIRLLTALQIKAFSQFRQITAHKDARPAVVRVDHRFDPHGGAFAVTVADRLNPEDLRARVD